MNRIIAILFFLICASLNGKAQINLVRNGSFEDKFTCPYAYDQVKDAKFWNCIDTAYVSSLNPFFGDPNCAPEYCNICGTGGGGHLLTLAFINILEPDSECLMSVCSWTTRWLLIINVIT